MNQQVSRVVSYLTPSKNYPGILIEECKSVYSKH